MRCSEPLHKLRTIEANIPTNVPTPDPAEKLGAFCFVRSSIFASPPSITEFSFVSRVSFHGQRAVQPCLNRYPASIPPSPMQRLLYLTCLRLNRTRRPLPSARIVSLFALLHWNSALRITHPTTTFCRAARTAEDTQPSTLFPKSTTCIF